MFKSTPKQAAASRANSQKSTGPRITAGKAASRFNALKHGVYAVHQIMFDEPPRISPISPPSTTSTTAPPIPMSAHSSIRSFTTSGVSAACAASKPASGRAPATPSS